MSVKNNKIQSFTANSSVQLTNLQELTSFQDGAPIKVQLSITQLDEIATILDGDVRNLVTPTK